MSMSASLGPRATPGRRATALVLSYAVDWILIVAVASVGSTVAIVTPNQRPFSLTDPAIGFPHVQSERISPAVLKVCGLVAPAVVILVVTLGLGPGRTASRALPKAVRWRRKLWEWQAGWLGLALSHAAASLITTGLKNLAGKSRPDLLARCMPDLQNASQYAVGGVGPTQEGFLLVTAAICKNDSKIVNEGFRSFPSAHASFAAAGLIYLSLFLASSLAITTPFLSFSPGTYSNTRAAAFSSRIGNQRGQGGSTEPSVIENTLSLEPNPNTRPSSHNEAVIATQNQAAAPPIYLLIFTVIPFLGSIFIAATRWSDYRHHGIDVVFGYFIGTVTAIFAFRYYHLPLSENPGCAWGPRSSDRSFWAGIGAGSYAQSSQDLETDLVASQDGEQMEDLRGFARY